MKSKPYNVRVFYNDKFDLVREFDTLEEAREFTKQYPHLICSISKVVEEKEEEK